MVAIEVQKPARPVHSQTQRTQKVSLHRFATLLFQAWCGKSACCVLRRGLPGRPGRSTHPLLLSLRKKGACHDSPTADLVSAGAEKLHKKCNIFVIHGVHGPLYQMRFEWQLRQIFIFDDLRILKCLCVHLALSSFGFRFREYASHIEAKYQSHNQSQACYFKGAERVFILKVVKISFENRPIPLP